MRRRIHPALALLGAGTVALAIPVLAQSAPESLLPPGFGAAEPAPPPAAPAPPRPAPVRPAPAAAAPVASASPPGSPLDEPSETQASEADALALSEATSPSQDPSYDLPPSARRSLDRVGPLTPALGGLGSEAFGRWHGAAQGRIMAATRAPLVSRWASILLRRALLTDSVTPADIDGADWVAERAWLLLRMGEADNARLLIQTVDNDRYSRRLYAVTMQSLLASADPGGFCGLLPRARDFSNEPGWFMAEAICASFSADQNRADALLDEAQKRGIAGGIDYRLTEKTVGAGPESRRSVRIEWAGTSHLTSWRFGLATANNVTIPDALYATVGPQVRAWEARAPMLAPADRLAGTMTATRLGVFSGRATRGFLSELAEVPDADGQISDMGGLLRTAYAGQLNNERAAAMRQFWSRPPADGTALGPGAVDYAALPVLARAAASMTPDKALGLDVPWLIAAMLSGGYDRNAARWETVVGGLQGMARQRSWGLLAVGAPRPQLALSRERIEEFVAQDETEGRRLGHLLIAALGGLDRLPEDSRAALLRGVDVDPVARLQWPRMLMAAARRGEKGTVALLVAAGLQARDWKDVPPTHLYFVTAALHEVGLEAYARMIAAEALARSG